MRPEHHITTCAGWRKRAQDFGAALSAELERQGLSQRAFALRVGCSDSQASRYASGATVPSVSTLIRIREALGCSWDTLLGEGES